MQETESSMELWGGIECSYNRVQNVYSNQLSLTGHTTRYSDIDDFAALGIKTLRYPVLWETHSNDAAWVNTSIHLNRCRTCGITPIAGLVHHGSGPAYTSLMDESFIGGLAHFAETVAKKFPWINYYTPVNEPLTTARFSGLYGLWYPHHKSDASFLRMLLNQVKAIKASMLAIRKINPAAQLIQTEDLGKTHATPLLQYQADFENHRRWLSYDLLCARVTRQHPLRDYLLNNGITADELDELQRAPVLPVVAGFNYYPTSERYLDENLANYPERLHGGNGIHQYADTEAVRVADCGISGRKSLLKEAWQRYQIPLALTEVHINCHREEQLRWLHETWKHAHELKKEGIDIKAVTSWSLLGAFDWNSLLTRNEGKYESGAFDISTGKTRRTAIAIAISKMNRTGNYEHPLLHNKGWWNTGSNTVIHPDNPRQAQRPLIIIGKSGSLAKAFSAICARRNIHALAVGRDETDVCNINSLKQLFDNYHPSGIINCSGYVKVDEAEVEKEQCYLLNTVGATLLAQICSAKGTPLLSFSSDLVFGGDLSQPYNETDRTSPLNVYGDSKLKAESGILAAFNEALVIRTSAFFSPWDRYNFAHRVREHALQSIPFDAADDVIISPTYLPDLVNTALDLFIDQSTGIWHVSNNGAISWADFASEIISRLGKNTNMLRKTKAVDMDWRAVRPRNSSLCSEKGIKLPSLDDALDRFLQHPAY